MLFQLTPRSMTLDDLELYHSFSSCWLPIPREFELIRISTVVEQITSRISEYWRRSAQGYVNISSLYTCAS